AGPAPSGVRRFRAPRRGRGHAAALVASGGGRGAAPRRRRLPAEDPGGGRLRGPGGLDPRGRGGTRARAGDRGPGARAPVRLRGGGRGAAGRSTGGSETGGGCPRARRIRLRLGAHRPALRRGDRAAGRGRMTAVAAVLALASAGLFLWSYLAYPPLIRSL